MGSFTTRTALGPLQAAAASLALGGLLVLSGGACGGSQRTSSTLPDRPPASWGQPHSFDDRNTTVQEDDLDGDGKTDHRAVLRRAGDPTSKLRGEWDLNHDGRVDVWQFFDERGEIEQAELDLDWDGRVDMILFYQEGRLERKEVATNFQGKMTVRKLYDGMGNLTTIEQDTDDDGGIDVWEFYQGGKLVRMGRDTNGDGQEDTFTEPSDAYRRRAEEALRSAAAPPDAPTLPTAPGPPQASPPTETAPAPAQP